MTGCGKMRRELQLRQRMSKRSFGCIVAALVFIVLTVLWLLATPWPSRVDATAPRDQAAVERRATQAAMARIAAQSRRAGLGPAPQTGPSMVEDAAQGGPPRGLSASELTPPEGYAFVPGPAPMAKARQPAGPEVEPPNADLDWLATPGGVAALIRQAEQAGRDWTFGWLRVGDPSQLDALRASLAPLGGEVLGASSNLVRARLPGGEADLRTISSLPEVGGLGALPAERKLSAMPEETLAKAGHEQVPVFVTLMASDADGRWRRELERLGAVVGRFDEDVRAYSANVEVAALEAVAAADFVAAVEPVRIVWAEHDLAVPAMGADALRAYQGAAGMFTGGGASTPVGVMDSRA